MSENESTTELDNPGQQPDFIPPGGADPVCSLCGDPAGGAPGDLVNHPNYDGVNHLSCMVSKEAYEQKRGSDARIREAEAVAKQAKKELAAKELTQPTTPCEAAKVDFEAAAIALESHEEQGEEILKKLAQAQGGFDKCRQEEVERHRRVAETLDKKLNPPKPLVEYITKGSSFKFNAPVYGGGGMAIVLIILVLLGVFDVADILPPEILIETNTVTETLPFPDDVEFTFDATDTECYALVKKWYANNQGQMFHDQPVEFDLALQRDKVTMVFRVGEDGELTLIRTYHVNDDAGTVILRD
jgi:hypothetical protein